MVNNNSKPTYSVGDVHTHILGMVIIILKGGDLNTIETSCRCITIR